MWQTKYRGHNLKKTKLIKEKRSKDNHNYSHLTRLGKLFHHNNLPFQDHIGTLKPDSKQDKQVRTRGNFFGICQTQSNHDSLDD